MTSLLNSSSFRIIFLIILTTILFQSKGYAQATGIGYNGYSDEVENITLDVTASEDDVQIFEDYEVKLIVPDGWRKAEPGDAIYYVTPYDYKTFFSLRKRLKFMNDRGDQVWIWKEEYDSDSPRDDVNTIEEVIDFAPIHRHIKTIRFKGKKRPYVELHIWKAYHIYEGKRVPFKVFAGYKTVPTFNPMLGIVNIFGVSTSADLDRDTENEIIKMAEMLSVYQKPKQKVSKKNDNNKNKRTSKASSKKEIDEMAKRVVANVINNLNKDTLDEKIDKTEEPVEYMGIKLKYGFQTYPGWANPDLKKIDEESVAWMIPSLKEGYKVKLIRSELIAPDLLFVGYNNANAVFNIEKKEIVWYDKKSSEASTLNFVMGNQEKIITCKKMYDNMHCFEALSSLSGEKLWSACVTHFENSPDNWLYSESTNSLIVISKNTEGIKIEAFDWETGESKWETAYKPEGKLPEPPLSFYTKNQFLYFDKNVNAVSLIDGKEIWQNDEIKLDKKNLLQEFSSDTIFILGKNQNLNWLDAKTGKIFRQVALSDTAIYTNIYLSENYVFLRGSVEEKDKQAKHFIQAFNKSNGELSWVYSDPVISLSNILEGKDDVYFATWLDLISINKNTGKVNFKTRVAQVGRTYPVTVQKYNDTLVYVGEMTIAGIDASDGTIIYKKDFNPISQLMNLDAIDTLCEEHHEYLKHFGKVGLDENAAKSYSGGYSTNMYRNAQQRASSLYAQSRKEYSSGNYWKSEILYDQARRQSDIAFVKLNVEIIALAMDMAVKSVDNFVRNDRDRYKSLLRRRESLMGIYENQIFGDYAIKETEEGDDDGSRYTRISIVHLPTGNVIYSRKKDRMEIDFTYNPVKKELYYHDRRLVPELEEISKNEEDGKAAHGYYLVGVPLKTGIIEN